MQRITGNWKTEFDEKNNIGELIIDNDYLEFSIRNEGHTFPCSFIGSDGDHNYKVYTKGIGKTRLKSLDNAYGYEVKKVALSKKSFCTGRIIENINSFSFEIPELIEWLGFEGVYVNYTENKELYAIEQKIEPIQLKKENPHVEIKYGPPSYIMPEGIDEKVEFIIKNQPRVYIDYSSPVNDDIIRGDIQTIMRFFGMMCGCVSYAQDIQLDILDDESKTWLYINEDFSHNFNNSDYILKMRTKYQMVKDHLNEYFENWYNFCNDDLYDIPRNVFFYNNKKKEIHFEDLFIEYCKILEGYDLRTSEDEKMADLLGNDILEVLKSKEAQSLFSTVFTNVKSKYKPKEVAQWIKRGFLERVSLMSRLKRLNKQYFNIISENALYIIKDSDPDNYYKAIVKTRNYITHHKVDKEGVMDGNQVMDSIGVLKGLITIIFFTHMGMHDERIKNIMIKDSDLWRYTSYLQVKEDK